MLVLLALLVVLSEIGLHVFFAANEKRYDISWVMLIIALIMGFTGMYVLNPARAKDGGRFIVDSSLRIISVVRNGRRKEDPLKVEIQNEEGQSAELAVPVIPPDNPEIPIEQIAASLGQIPKRRQSDHSERAD